uniref:Uncharacterized protein LOC105852844 n=1 Tax=Cicer arietinum TaxID=3827 RepID=A0A3Q7Y6F6_CICAR|nr:uncharacterized protein LOC105852844 [Cicer arietinum]
MAHFLPEGVRDGLAHEFERLEQTEGMTVSEYSAHFTQLSRHAPYPIIEEMRVKRFIRGLKDYLFKYVVGSNCYTFAEVLSLVLQIEQRRRIKEAIDKIHERNKCLMDLTITIRTVVVDVCLVIRGNKDSCLKGVVIVGSLLGQFHIQNCYKDGNAKVCYQCGRDAHVLFDLGATHSFVSSWFATRLGKCSSFLEEPLVVAKPVGGNLLAKSVYRSCDINIDGKVLPVDLVVIDLVDFDAILGMDWLALHHATLDCQNKMVKFEIPGQSVFSLQGDRCWVPHNQISALIASKLMRRGCQAYLVLVRDTQVAEEELEKIPIACEFPNVFPEELPRLPPDREIEFSIDLVPNTDPISIPLIVWPQ